MILEVALATLDRAIDTLEQSGTAQQAIDMMTALSERRARIDRLLADPRKKWSP